MKKLNKGFTLIELLVVIAIIGILSAVVLASLNSARDKGKDASAKSSMESIRSSAEIYYNSAGANKYATDGNEVAEANIQAATVSTDNVCVSADVVKLAAASNKQTNTDVKCSVGQNANSYVVYTTLNDTTKFCVDSSGFSGAAASPTPGTSSSDAKCQ